MSLQSGQVWQNEKGQRIFTQWLLGQEWALLGTPSERVHGGTEMIPIPRKSGVMGCIWYAPGPLEAWLTDHGWERTDITIVENL